MLSNMKWYICDLYSGVFMLHGWWSSKTNRTQLEVLFDCFCYSASVLFNHDGKQFIKSTLGKSTSREIKHKHSGFYEFARLQL